MYWLIVLFLANNDSEYLCAIWITYMNRQLPNYYNISSCVFHHDETCSTCSITFENWQIPVKSKHYAESRSGKRNISSTILLYLWMRKLNVHLSKYFGQSRRSVEYRLSPPKKKYNRTFSINSFQNCKLILTCFMIIKLLLIICISAKTPSDLVQ